MRKKKHNTYKVCVLRGGDGEEIRRMSHGSNKADWRHLIDNGATFITEYVIPNECPELADGKTCPACERALQQIKEGKTPATSYEFTDEPDKDAGAYLDDNCDYIFKRVGRWPVGTPVRTYTRHSGKHRKKLLEDSGLPDGSYSVSGAKPLLGLNFAQLDLINGVASEVSG